MPNRASASAPLLGGGLVLSPSLLFAFVSSRGCSTKFPEEPKPGGYLPRLPGGGRLPDRKRAPVDGEGFRDPRRGSLIRTVEYPVAPSFIPFLPSGHDSVPMHSLALSPCPSQSATAPRLLLEGLPPFTLFGQPGNGSYFFVSCTANSPTKTPPTRRSKPRQLAERNVANPPNEIDIPSKNGMICHR